MASEQTFGQTCQFAGRFPSNFGSRLLLQQEAQKQCQAVGYRFSKPFGSSAKTAKGYDGEDESKSLWEEIVVDDETQFLRP
jgi:hypothetical protein